MKILAIIYLTLFSFTLNAEVAVEGAVKKHSSVVANYRVMNAIGPSMLNNGALGSSHKSMGIAIRYIFKMCNRNKIDFKGGSNGSNQR